MRTNENSSDAYHRGQEAFDRGDFETALAIFLDIAMSDSDFDACFNAGNAADELGEPHSAETLLRTAWEHGVVDAGRNLADVLLRAGRKDAARVVYKDAAEAGDLNAAIDLGELYEQDGDLPEALAWYRRSYDEPDAYVRVARVSRLLGDQEGAAEALRLGAAVAGDAAAEYAELLFERNQQQNALDVLWKASRFDPDRGLVPLAFWLDELGDTAGAERILREAIARNDLYAHNNLAVILWKRGARDEAISHWETGIRGGDEKASRTLRRALDGTLAE